MIEFEDADKRLRLMEGEPKWVYISDLLGLPKVPVDVAQLIRRVVHKAERAGLITNERARIVLMEWAFVALEQEIDMGVVQ